MVVDPVAIYLTQQKPIVRISLVIFGAVMIHLSLGTYHTFGNLLPYMASFMRNHTDDSVRLEQLMWIPMFQGCFPLAMVIGGCLASKLGSRMACMLGCFLTSFGVLFSTWTIQYSYFAFLFTYGLMFGLGQGMAYVIAVASVINWAPKMVGFATGIVAAGFGISSSIFAPIQTQMVNPNNYPPTKDGYFVQTDLLLRVPSTFFNLSIVYFVMQCVGLIFICDPPSDFSKNLLANSALIDMAWLSKRRTRWMSGTNSAIRDGFRRFGKSQKQSDVSYSKYGYIRLPLLGEGSSKRTSSRKTKANSSADEKNVGTSTTSVSNGLNAVNMEMSQNNNDYNNNQNNEEELANASGESDVESSESDLEISKPPAGGGLSIGNPVSLTTQQMIGSSTFYFLFISLFCCSFYGNMFYNLYKTFAETFIADDFFLAMAFSVGSIANSVARVVWGLLTDRTSFQVTLSVATSCASILLFTMPATAVVGKYLFLVWLILMFVCMGATHALFITATVRCFGSRYKSTNYGALIFSTTLSGVFLALLSQHFLEQVGYTWAFVFTAIFPFVAFLLTTAIRVTPQGHLIV